jgi:hypothetical protein
LPSERPAMYSYFVSLFLRCCHSDNHVRAIHDSAVIRTTDCSHYRRFRRARDVRARVACEGRSGLRSWFAVEGRTRGRIVVRAPRKSFDGSELASSEPPRTGSSAVLGAELLRRRFLGAEFAHPSQPTDRRAVALRLDVPRHHGPWRFSAPAAKRVAKPGESRDHARTPTATPPHLS